jgi:hypothetical protein
LESVDYRAKLAQQAYKDHKALRVILAIQVQED